jgi:hypothetical protein
MKKKTPTLNIKQTDDLDLIGRLLVFANADTFKSQEHVYGIFRDHPYVLRVDGEPYIAPIPQSEGVGPFLNDQWQIKRALSIISSGEQKAINELLDTVEAKLREKLHGVVDVDLRRGDLSLRVYPILDGMEAILWFGVALIFENDIINLVRRCQFELDDGEQCGKFFIYTPQRRKYCAEHAVVGKKQAVLRAIRRWQAGEGPRMGSRKQKKGRSRRKSSTKKERK